MLIALLLCRTVPAVVFWQWINQSFNALVNYTNRNAKSQVSTTQLGVAYASATSAALVTALGLKSFLEKRAGSLLQRYVPFAAVAAANCVNIPLMRQSELINGIAVYDDNGNAVTESRVICTIYLPFWFLVTFDSILLLSRSWQPQRESVKLYFPELSWQHRE